MSNRKNKHDLARQLMLQDDYSSAARTLEELIQNQGPHILALADLTASYYMTQQMDLFARSFKRFEREFNLARNQFSTGTYLKALLILAKFHEELGELSTAVLTYQEGLRLSKDDLALEQKFAIQLLRVKSWLGKTDDLHKLYLQCYNYSEVSIDLMPELEHGLMLAELKLFGETPALTRLQSAWVSEKYLKSDLRLMTLDLAEELLFQSKNLKVILRFELSNLDAFEKILNEMLRNQNVLLSAKEFTTLDRKIPLMGILRLLALSLKRATLTNSEEYFELKRKFLFLLGSLSVDSQKLLRTKWQAMLEDTQFVAALKISDQEIIAGERVLKTSSFGFNCILILLEKSGVVPTDIVIQKLYGIPMDESTYARLKTAIQRLNKDLEKYLGLPKTLELNKEFLRLNGVWKKI